MIQGVIIQGTTPEHEFTLPFDTSLIKELRISYCQKEKEVLVKEYSDCYFEGNIIKVQLTQTDTFMLNDRSLVEIQIRVLTVDNDVSTNDGEILLKVKRGYNKEELV